MIWHALLTVTVLVLVVYFAVKRLRKQNTAVSDSLNRPFYKHVLAINHINPDGKSRQEIISNCRKDEELVLVPEPDNHHDPGAVKVCRKNGEQIGYLPADSGRMAHDLETGWIFRTTIDDIYPFEENPRKHGVRLRLEVLTRGNGLETTHKIRIE